MKMTWVDFSKTVLAWCALGLPISAVPLTGAFAAPGDISFSKETVLLKVKPAGKFDSDWFEATFCLESATPFQVSDLFVQKVVELRMPDLDFALVPTMPPFPLGRVFRQPIDANKPTIADDQQKYRYTSRAPGQIWDLQLDPSPNTSCYPGIWGYIWVNKLDIYGSLRTAPGSTPWQYRKCIRGDSGLWDCGNGLDEAEMIFKLVGIKSWKGQVRLEPKRKNFNNGTNNEKFIIAD
jgi:hypothetical protein